MLQGLMQGGLMKSMIKSLAPMIKEKIGEFEAFIISHIQSVELQEGETAATYFLDHDKGQLYLILVTLKDKQISRTINMLKLADFIDNLNDLEKLFKQQPL